MELKDFESVRVGSGFPASVDVQRIEGHESYGVMAIAHTYRMEGETGYTQVRKHNKHNMIALFTFKYEGMNIPEFWEDSTVIWDSRSDS